MPKPPPTAIRYLVLLAALALLVTAVCAKTEQANEPVPQSPHAVPLDPAPETEAETAADAGLPPPVSNEQAAPQANPPADSQNKGKNKNSKPEPEFFPATKSGGMF